MGINKLISEKNIELSQSNNGTYKKVNTILISQPPPEDSKRSPYHAIEQKYGIKVDFRQFIHVEPVEAKEFRRQRVNFNDYSAVIFTSKNSIEHFFRMCEATRVKMPQDMKYFCLSEAVALYLQKFIVYRKRKVFFGKRTIQDMRDQLVKHRKKEKFLLPCSNLGSKDVVAFLKDNEFDFRETMLYKTVASDLSDLENITYDMLVFFSPLGIHSLYENFPDFIQKETRIAVFGKKTSKAVTDKKLTINIKAPIPEAPSMTMAIELYLQKSNKK